MKWLGVTVLLSLVLFAMVGIISSALEIFFVLSTTLLARRLWYLVGAVEKIKAFLIRSL